MSGRRLTVLLMFYVTADLSNPWMPGAFVFNADESVEATSVHRQCVERPSTASISFKSNTPEFRPQSELLRLEPRVTVPAPVSGEWFVALRRAHTPFHEPPSAVDDH